MSRTAVLVLLLSSIPVATVLLGGAEESPSYAISTDPSEEILFFGRSGGLRLLDAQYRLFGDGRLVREIVAKSRRDTPYSQEETQLTAAEIAAIFQRIVEAGLPTMDKDSALPGRDLWHDLQDGRYFFLRLRFDEYRDDGVNVSPFSSDVTIQEPELQLEHFPRVPELQAFVAVVQSLSSHFFRTDMEALRDADLLTCSPV